MDFKIVFSIRHLLFEGIDKIETPIFTITNDPSVKEEVLDEQFLLAAGQKARRSFLNNTFAYCIPANGQDESQSNTGLNRELVSCAQNMETFLLFLWLVKDNSISLEESYGYSTEKSIIAYWTSHNIFSTSSGNFEDISFSDPEINEVVDLLLKYARISPQEPEELSSFDFSSADPNQAPQLKPGVRRDKMENRIQRAFSFLSTARSTPHLPQKITHYMSILESLFSTDANEVLHKVSERTAYFIGADKSDRLEIFRTVKKAYDTRSKFVHGQKVKNTFDNLAPLCAKIDNIVRAVLKKIVLTEHLIFLKKDDELTEYLIEIIF